MEELHSNENKREEARTSRLDGNIKKEINKKKTRPFAGLSS